MSENSERMTVDVSEGRLARTLGIAIGGIGPILVAGALVGIRDSIANADVALLLVLVVVLAAVTGGWQAGAVGAVSSALSFDFFHTKPYLSLTMDSREDAITALLLLLVGISVGVLAGRAREARTAASYSSSEIARIHRIAELAAHGAHGEDVVFSAQTELRELMGLVSCRFEAPPHVYALATIERNGAVTGTSVRHYAGGQLELPREGAELPVLARGQQIGRFVLEPRQGVGVSLEQRLVAVAIADQVGAALTTPSARPTLRSSRR
jgi:K+-sensing histidine kinase KdpD